MTASNHLKHDAVLDSLIFLFLFQNSLDVSFDAGGNVNAGLTATTLVSQWTWAATLLQSATVGSKVRDKMHVKDIDLYSLQQRSNIIFNIHNISFTSVFLNYSIKFTEVGYVKTAYIIYSLPLMSEAI